MAAPGPAFVNEVGNPADPAFAQLVQRAHTIESNGNLRPSFNVWHFRKRSSAVLANVHELQQAFEAQIKADFDACMSVHYQPDPWESKMLDAPLVPPVVTASTLAPSVVGDRYGSGNGCGTMRLLTNGAGRNFRGSKHFSPIAESQTTLDQFNAGAQALWTSFAATVLSSPIMDATGNEWDLIVLSQELSSWGGIGPTTFTGAYVLTNPINLQIGTMRRRRQKGGLTF